MSKIAKINTIVTNCYVRVLLLVQLVWLALLTSYAALADLPDVIEHIKPSVVGIGSVMKTRTPAMQLSGTGFVVGDGRHVLTNAHVVSKLLDLAHDERLVVFVGQGVNPDVRKAEKVALDPEHDLALLKISGMPLPSVKLGSSLLVREGGLYVFTGFPIGSVLGLYPASHRGIVSAITPIAAPMGNGDQLNSVIINRLRSPYDIYQLDATAYPGNSGSPMYDVETGRVVGIVNMVFVKESKESILSHPSGITYAIPIRYAREMLQRQGLNTE